MVKILQINDSGFVWETPLATIATHRAKYYAAKDPDTTFQAEFDYVMEDSYEGIDWFLNNMDFEDIADVAVLVESPAPLKAPRMNSGSCVTQVISRAGEQP